MAVTKIWKINRSFADPIRYIKDETKTRNPEADRKLQMLEDVIEYAANEDKTEKKFFVSGINCDRDHARDELLLQRKYGETVSRSLLPRILIQTMFTITLL